MMVHADPVAGAERPRPWVEDRDSTAQLHEDLDQGFLDGVIGFRRSESQAEREAEQGLPIVALDGRHHVGDGSRDGFGDGTA